MELSSQLSISKLGVVKIGAQIIDPRNLPSTDENYQKWFWVNELQFNFWGAAVWLVGDFIHAYTDHGQYRVSWTDHKLLEGYLSMNAENLKKLAEYLPTVSQPRFSMRAYARDYHGDHLEPIAAECKTVGCALGYGPEAGLPPQGNEEWGDYCNRVFGLISHSAEWGWCFDQEWARVDNTPAGAAKRIMHLVEHGLPENHQLQRWDRAEYMFREAA